MFTGIIQSKGKVVKRVEGEDGIRFGFRFSKKTHALKLGESIAIDGVCLTVTKMQGLSFEVDTIWQTLEATNLSALMIGDRVNLERSLRFGDFMGGHFVTGHVDAVGTIKKVKSCGDSWDFFIQAPKSLAAMITPKGSIAVDGISLTVQKKQAMTFVVGIIPHTYRETNLGKKSVGDRVHLEVDLLARYAQARGRKPKELKGRKLAMSDFLVHGF